MLINGFQAVMKAMQSHAAAKFPVYLTHSSLQCAEGQLHASSIEVYRKPTYWDLQHINVALNSFLSAILLSWWFLQAVQALRSYSHKENLAKASTVKITRFWSPVIAKS
jgi:hypothetical protein